ncbi:MAG: hypothetical protein M3O90_11410, partial [Actinomycetota bacterium]|nr:hypothetical protein [Actinomycetota bacterium]
MSTVTIVVVGIWNGLLLAALAALVIRWKQVLQWITQSDGEDRNEWERSGADGWAAFLAEHPELEDQQPVEALERTVRTKRSAMAFAFGARTGVRTILICSLQDLVERAAVLVSRSRIRNRRRSKMPVKLRLRACWVTQFPSGFVVQPARCTH